MIFACQLLLNGVDNWPQLHANRANQTKDDLRISFGFKKAYGVDGLDRFNRVGSGSLRGIDLHCIDLWGFAFLHRRLLPEIFLQAYEFSG